MDWLFKLDGWTIVGWTGQLMFTSRFLFQWLATERARKSVMPIAFWYCSVIGALIQIPYSIHLQSPPLLLGFVFVLAVAGRNLYFLRRDGKAFSETSR